MLVHFDHSQSLYVLRRETGPSHCNIWNSCTEHSLSRHTGYRTSLILFCQPAKLWPLAHLYIPIHQWILIHIDLFWIIQILLEHPVDGHWCCHLLNLFCHFLCIGLKPCRLKPIQFRIWVRSFLAVFASVLVDGFVGCCETRLLSLEVEGSTPEMRGGTLSSSHSSSRSPACSTIHLLYFETSPSKKLMKVGRMFLHCG